MDKMEKKPDPVSLPYEVFQLIIGAVSFVDLPYFIQASRAINDGFKDSLYSKQLKLIEPDDLKILHAILRMKDFENAWHHWTTADILTTYTSPFCQHCGDYGYSFIWCSVPAIKLCGSCLSLPQFRFVSLRTARATYGYSKAEVATIPFMKIPTGLSHPGVVLDLHGRLRPGSKVVLRYSLMTRAEKNGTDPLADIAPCSYNELCSHVSHWTKANTSLFGVMKPTVTWDQKLDRWVGEVICEHCKPSQDELTRWVSLMSPFFEYPPKLIPRTHDHLRRHIEMKHKPLLKYYDESWKALPDEMKESFERPNPHRVMFHSHTHHPIMQHAPLPPPPFVHQAQFIPALPGAGPPNFPPAAQTTGMPFGAPPPPPPPPAPPAPNQNPGPVPPGPFPLGPPLNIPAPAIAPPGPLPPAPFPPQGAVMPLPLNGPPIVQNIVGPLAAFAQLQAPQAVPMMPQPQPQPQPAPQVQPLPVAVPAAIATNIIPPHQLPLPPGPIPIPPPGAAPPPHLPPNLLIPGQPIPLPPLNPGQPQMQPMAPPGMVVHLPAQAIITINVGLAAPAAGQQVEMPNFVVNPTAPPGPPGPIMLNQATHLPLAFELIAQQPPPPASAPAPLPILPRSQQPWIPPLPWSSWAMFMHHEFRGYPVLNDLMIANHIADKMDSLGPLFGLPKPPRGYSEWRDNMSVNGIDNTFHSKQAIAVKLSQRILNGARREVWEEMKRRIDKDGVEVLREMLEGPWIFKRETSDEDGSTTANGGNATAETQAEAQDAAEAHAVAAIVQELMDEDDLFHLDDDFGI